MQDTAAIKAFANIKKNTRVDFAGNFRAQVAGRTRTQKTHQCVLSYSGGALVIDTENVNNKTFRAPATSVKNITFYINDAYTYAEVVTANGADELSMLFNIETENVDDILRFREIVDVLASEANCEVSEIIDENHLGFVYDDECDEEENNESPSSVSSHTVDLAFDESVKGLENMRRGFYDDKELFNKALNDASSNNHPHPVSEQYGIGNTSVLFPNGIESAIGEVKYDEETAAQAVSDAIDATSELGADYACSMSPDELISFQVDIRQASAMKENILRELSKTGLDLHSQLAGLATKLAESSEENRALKSTATKTAAKHNQLLESYSSTRVKIDELSRENDDLQRDLRFAEAAKKRADQYVADARTEIAKLVAETERKVKIAEQEKIAARAQADNDQRARMAAEMRMDEIVREYDLKNADLENRMRELDAAIKINEDEKAAAQATVDDVTRKLEEYAAKAMEQIDEEHERTRELEEALKAKDAEKNDLQRQIDGLTGQKEMLVQEKELLEQEYQARIDAIKADLNTKISDLMQQLEESQYESAALKEESEARALLYEELERTNAELRVAAEQSKSLTRDREEPREPQLDEQSINATTVPVYIPFNGKSFAQEYAAGYDNDIALLESMNTLLAGKRRLNGKDFSAVVDILNGFQNGIDMDCYQQACEQIELSAIAEKPGSIENCVEADYSFFDIEETSDDWDTAFEETDTDFDADGLMSDLDPFASNEAKIEQLPEIDLSDKKEDTQSNLASAFDSFNEMLDEDIYDETAFDEDDFISVESVREDRKAKAE